MSAERHSRAQELFEQAEILSTGERESFLRTACRDDAALRREVDELLEAAASMPEDFLEPPRPPPAQRVPVGETIAHYRVLKRLGAGGMGEVYLAEDERLKRRVALKILPPELAGSPERLERFQREAEAVAALNHPNIVTIHSIESVEGLRFLTMELVDGPTLRQLLDRADPLPVADVLDLALQIAEGLAEAHAAGIVHRDLKPGNVMVAPNGRVKLLDFGLARTAGPLQAGGGQPQPRTPITKDGAILGTVAYMSPEQLAGRPVDSRSDIFSLGIVLFELATGRHPFPAETEASILAKILEREPDDLLELRPDLPRPLERLVARCLEKDPAKRHQDTAQLARDLRRLRRAEKATSTTALRPSLDGSVPSPGRRSVLAAAAAIALVLGALGLWHWSTPGNTPGLPERDLSVAVLPLRNISQDPEESDYLAEGIGQAVATRLTQAGLRVAPWETVQRLLEARPHLAAKEISEELGVETLLTGTFLLVEDRLRTTHTLVDASGIAEWAGEFDEAFEDIFTIQSQIALRVAESLKPHLTPEELALIDEPESENLDAYDFYLQGAHFLHADDRNSTEVALEYFRRALEIDPELGEAHIGLGAAHSTLYVNMWGGVDNLRVAEESYLAALRLEPASSPTAMRARRGLISVEGDRGRSEEVLIHARDARRLGRPDDVETLSAVAEGYAYGGFAELAVPIFRRILELDPLNEGAAWQLVISANWAAEIEAVVEAGGAYVSRFGDDSLIHYAIASSYYLMGRLDRAETHYRKAISSKPDLGSLYSSITLGHLYQESGRQDEGLAAWRAALEAARSREGEVTGSPRLMWLRATLETCSDGASSQRNLNEMLAQSQSNAMEISYLAAGLARQGDWQHAVELLQWTLDHGSVSQIWKLFFRVLGLDPEAPELAEFRQAFERARMELAQKYARADPEEELLAR